jgi:hypothetical protein
MSVEFHDSGKLKNSASLSETLNSIAASIPANSAVSLRELLGMIGEEGLLLFCMFLTVPFMVPVQIPGVSTVFGLVIVLIGVSVTLNRIPWLPARLMNRTIQSEHLVPALEKAGQLFTRIDRFIRPRLLPLTHGPTLNRFNGLMLLFAGILLMAPLAIIPFSNMIPALAILFLAAGILQRDGFFILLGYLFVVLTLIYFGVIALGVIAAGQSITSLIGS